jgi:hypothetical protein
VDWIDLAQDRNKGKALVNAVINLWVLYSARNLSDSSGTTDS